MLVFSLAVNLLSAALALGGGAVLRLHLHDAAQADAPRSTSSSAVPPEPSRHWSVGRRCTGNIGWPAFVLFAIVFLWTPPHFWSLALLLRDDYRNANVPMLPVLIGTAEHHRRILAVPRRADRGEPAPGAGRSARVRRSPRRARRRATSALALWARAQGSSRAAALLFHYSLAYLALVFVAGAVAASW